MTYIDEAEREIGYRVQKVERGAFTVVGHTRILQPGEDRRIRAFWRELEGDGRLALLRAATSGDAWVLGLGSWDPQCPEGGQRYTVCIEEPAGADLSDIESSGPLFRKKIGASAWLHFEIPKAGEFAAFAEADVYRMMRELGYRLNTSGYDVGLHFDAYPPGPLDVERPMEFRITVVAIEEARITG